MKDKRTYLKVACLLEAFYIVSMLIYYLFFKKFSDEVLASLFMLIISVFFTIMLYNESKKDVEVLKNNKLKIVIASIWLFFEPVIPGILGFIFLSTLREKKDLKLPLVKDEERNTLAYVKAFLTLIIFSFIMFVLPFFDFFDQIPSIVIYAFIILIILLFYYNELKSNLVVFIKNFKTYLPFIIKRYLIMLGVMVVVATPIILLNNGETSTNQTMVNALFEKIPIQALILSTLYAPIVEETVFRLSLSKLFTNKTLFIIMSGILFGSLHVIDKFTSVTDLLYIFQYSALGICLAKAYADSKNIFVSISMHFIQNFLAAVLVLLLY